MGVDRSNRRVMSLVADQLLAPDRGGGTLRIGIDNISPGEATSIGGPGGMRMYLQSLLTEFAIQAPEYRYVLFTPAWADPLLDPMPENVEVVRLRGVPVNRPMRTLYQQALFPVSIAAKNLDVFFATATVAPLMCTVPLVVAIQFLQFYALGGGFGKARTKYLRLMVPLSVRKAAGVIAFSQSAKTDLAQHTDVPQQKVSVVPHGIAESFLNRPLASQYTGQIQEVMRYTGAHPYVLYVSALYEYKNHSRLIRAFGALKRRAGVEHVLLIVGSQVTVSVQELQAVAGEEGISDSVIFAGHLDPQELLIAAYLGADLFVFPSLNETFGFPPLEAMACGCPVVTSNLGSMAEVAGDAAVLIDPLDIESIARGMEVALGDADLRKRLIAEGLKRVRQYTWSNSARMTLEVLTNSA